MKLYPKFRINVTKGDFVSFDSKGETLFKVINKSYNGKFILVYDAKSYRWRWFADIQQVWGVSYE